MYKKKAVTGIGIDAHGNHLLALGLLIIPLFLQLPSRLIVAWTTERYGGSVDGDNTNGL